METNEAFDLIGEGVRPVDLHDAVFISSDPGGHASRLAEMAELGSTRCTSTTSARIRASSSRCSGPRCYRSWR